MGIRVGLPQGLLYYQYGSIWEYFLQELGAEVVVSGRTTRETLDCGSILDEVCLPAKVCFGHAYKLRSEVDYMFMPRIVSVAKNQYTCPKIIGMPDLLRCNIENLPPLIDFNVNLRQGQRKLYETIIAAGKVFNRHPLTSLYAWYQAWRHRKQEYLHNLLSGKAKVSLIGHPYMIYDQQISMNVLERLKKLKLDVLTAETVSPNQAETAAKSLGKKLFWSNSHHLAGAALALMTAPQPVKGVIFLTSFSCGPDALVGELLSQRAEQLGIPCMILSVDEHTAEAGFVTRLEAFADMLTWRYQSC